MTTDTAERTEAIIEATPEPVAAPSDAGLSNGALTEQTPADTQSQQSEAPLPDTAEDYVKQMLEREGAEQASDTKEQPKPLIDPQEVARRTQAVKQRHTERQSAIDAYKSELMAEGMSEALATRIVNEMKGKLNEHHNDLLQNAGYESAEQTRADVGRQLWTGITGLDKPLAEAVTKAIQAEASKEGGSGEVSYADVIRMVSEESGKAAERKGYERGLSKGFTDGRQAGERSARGGESGQQVDGSAANGGPLTRAKFLKMTPDQQAQAWKDYPDQVRSFTTGG